MVQQVPPPPSTSSGQAGKPRPPRPREWTRARMDAFLATLAATQSVSRASVAAGMGRQSAYKLRKRSAPFAAAWDEAVEPSRLTVSPARHAGARACPLCGAPPLRAPGWR